MPLRPCLEGLQGPQAGGQWRRSGVGVIEAGRMRVDDKTAPAGEDGSRMRYVS